MDKLQVSETPGKVEEARANNKATRIFKRQPPKTLSFCGNQCGLRPVPQAAAMASRLMVRSEWLA